MHSFPLVSITHHKVVLAFADLDAAVSEMHIAMVIDLDWEGECIGIEVLNIVLTVGQGCLAVIERTIGERPPSSVRYSYTKESDSFYLRLANRPSSNQESVDGLLHLDASGAIVGLEAHYG